MGHGQTCSEETQATEVVEQVAEVNALEWRVIQELRKLHIFSEWKLTIIGLTRQGKQQIVIEPTPRIKL